MNFEKAGMEHLFHKRNGLWKNPPTHKRPMAVSRGKLSMDVTLNIFSIFMFNELYLSLNDS